MTTNRRILIDKEVVKINKSIFTEFKKTLLVTSSNLLDLFSDYIGDIEEYATEVYLVDDYSVKEAHDISYYLTINSFDCIISFGGGTINDTCKLASYYSKKHMIAIPTIISNDGVASNVSVLKFKDNRTDGIPSKSPDDILVDINIIKNAPKKYIKAGLGDILSNYTAIYDWDIAIKAGKEVRNDAAKLISNTSFWSIFNLPDNLTDNLFTKLVCESIVLSGISMEMKGNTRPCSGAEHLFNHAIKYYYPEKDILHGLLVALGSLVSSKLQGQDSEKILKFLKRHQIDVRPSKLGLTKEEFIFGWLNAKPMRDRYTILDEIELDAERLSSIYDEIEKEGII